MSTSTPRMPLEIRHLPESSRFQAVVDGSTCVVDYRLSGNVMAITHTEVPPALEGRGYAGELVQAVIEHARAHGLKVDPLCSYARHYLRLHPEAADVLS